jgi:hypothetical protein
MEVPVVSRTLDRMNIHNELARALIVALLLVLVVYVIMLLMGKTGMPSFWTKKSNFRPNTDQNLFMQLHSDTLSSSKSMYGRR